MGKTMVAEQLLRPKQDLSANALLLGASVLAIAAWGTTPEHFGSSAAAGIVPIVLGALSGTALLRAFGKYRDNFRLRKKWEHARTTYQEKDDRLLDESERKILGMRNTVGRLLGTTPDGRPVTLPDKIRPAYEVFVGGQGVGKTSTQALFSSILSTITLGGSYFFYDCKKEIMPQIAETLRRFGVELVCVNIGAGAQDVCPGVEVALFEAAISAFYSDDPDHHKLTSTFIRGYAEIICSKQEGDSSPAFFFDNAEIGFFALFIYLLIFEPDNVTPTRMWQIASNPILALRCLKRLRAYSGRGMNAVIEAGQSAATTLLEMHNEESKYFPQFMNKIALGLRTFDSSGPLAHFGRGAIVRISDLRERPIVFASMTPLSGLKDMSVFSSLLAYNFFSAAKANPAGLPIRGLFDEFLALHLPGFTDEMLTLRGLKVYAEIYIKSLKSLKKKLGENEADVFFEQVDMWQMSGLTFEDAKFASEILGTRNVRRQTASVRGVHFEDVGFSFQDSEEPLYTVQELMALPLEQQIVKIRGYRPDILLKVPTWKVAGFRELLADNPLEGPAPKSAPDIRMHVTKNGYRFLWWRKRKIKRENNFPKKERFFRSSSFLWVLPWLAAGIFGAFDFSKPIPHIYWAKSHLGCEYVSVSGRTVLKPSDHCPPIWIQQGGGQF
jgi:type IV secretion system protein VirD4